MNCPVCGKELKPADRQGIEVDYCPDCHGVWIGREQLDQILARPSPFEANWTDDPSRGKESFGVEWALAPNSDSGKDRRICRPGFGANCSWCEPPPNVRCE